MVNPAWRDALRQELARRGLPRSYVERLLTELCDHCADMEANMRMEAGTECSLAARMGRPAHLAAAAFEEYQKARFCRRHPVVTFALFPVLSLAAAWGMLLVAVYALTTSAELDESTSFTLADLLISNGCILIPIAAVALLFGRFARNQGVDQRWPLLSTGVLAVIASSMWSSVIFPGPQHEPMLGLMLGLPVRAQPILQALLILTIGVWTCSKRVRKTS
jgi:hypothetical protein